MDAIAASMLADELPNGQLLNANSIVELRTRPERLTRKIADFVDACWAPRPARSAPARRRTARAPQRSRRRAATA